MLTAPERRVILNNIDKLVNSTKDNLLIECLYLLAVDFSPKNSEQLTKYNQLLNQIRSNVYQTIDHLDIGDIGILSAKEGYFYFNFKSPNAIDFKISHSVLKDLFNFRWDRFQKVWLKKQSNMAFNLDDFTKVMIEKVQEDLKKTKPIK